MRIVRKLAERSGLEQAVDWAFEGQVLVESVLVALQLLTNSKSRAPRRSQPQMGIRRQRAQEIEELTKQSSSVQPATDGHKAPEGSGDSSTHKVELFGAASHRRA